MMKNCCVGCAGIFRIEIDLTSEYRAVRQVAAQIEADPPRHDGRRQGLAIVADAVGRRAAAGIRRELPRHRARHRLRECMQAKGWR